MKAELPTQLGRLNIRLSQIALHKSLLACEARRKRRAWGVSPGSAEIEMEPATAGDSILQVPLSPVITGLNHDLRLPWGSRPRLYAYALLRRLGDCSETWHAGLC